MAADLVLGFGVSKQRSPASIQSAASLQLARQTKKGPMQRPFCDVSHALQLYFKHRSALFAHSARRALLAALLLRAVEAFLRSA